MDVFRVCSVVTSVSTLVAKLRACDTPLVMIVKKSPAFCKVSLSKNSPRLVRELPKSENAALDSLIRFLNLFAWAFARLLFFWYSFNALLAASSFSSSSVSR